VIAVQGGRVARIEFLSHFAGVQMVLQVMIDAQRERERKGV